ncbi:hypothetical protein SteCoe_24340 [Stentor coeruleus]|uniref:Uncharacterized protein n=1 Tax=Stentor coeruleus TaxID=5963 RepID=A0A1R2BHW8_9CILI|nr:hypothetical protein SteCoe_24340 [Stentor coeruleus]
MESNRIKSTKNIIQFPNISERFFQDKNKDQPISALNITTRVITEKSSIAKNFFLPLERKDSSPAATKTPNYKTYVLKPRVNEKKLEELDSELDKQEMAIQQFDANDVNSIESMFFAYSSYFEDLIQSISEYSHVYKRYLTRAKNGFIGIFRKLFPKLKHIAFNHFEKSSQTLMTINPNKYSTILSKLGDIINDEVSNTDKIEKYIQKIYVQNKRKHKINTIGTQTEYKINSDGVLQYNFKSYEDLQNEINLLEKQNNELKHEKYILTENYKCSDDIDKLINRNKVLESMIIEMRNKMNTVNTKVVDSCNENYSLKNTLNNSSHESFELDSENLN